MHMTSRRIDIGKNKQSVLHIENLRNRLQMELCSFGFFIGVLQNWESNLLG